MNNQLINHIAYVLDSSGSMAGLSDQVIKVFDEQIKYLAKRSQELNQETRVSVYLFNETTQCIVFDKDVMRLPSLKGLYQPDGGTALIDATLKAIDDLKDTSTLYFDHAFLMYVQTDGEENRSNFTAAKLTKEINNLPDNWTVAVFVPNQHGVQEAKRFGFPAANVQIWETTSKGLKESASIIQRSTDAFMQGRAAGIRGTKNLFAVDAASLTVSAVKNNLRELKPSEYQLLPVSKDSIIQPFVESWTGGYTKGSAYYMLTKPESVQGYKQVCIQNKLNGKVYAGTEAREMLGLPDYEVKVQPGDHGDWDIFCQSTSTNRKLPKGSKVLVLN